MEAIRLEIQSTVFNGRTQVGDIIAYYEQLQTNDGKLEGLRVSFLKDKSIRTTENGSEQVDVQEESMNASIEYNLGIFRSQIREQDNMDLLWEIFWNIFYQLKPKE